MCTSLELFFGVWRTESPGNRLGILWFVAGDFVIISSASSPWKSLDHMNHQLGEDGVFLVPSITLQQTNISHQSERKLIFPTALGWDMLVPGRVDEKIGVINRKIFQYPAARAERNMCQGGAPALKVLVGEIWEINDYIKYMFIWSLASLREALIPEIPPEISTKRWTFRERNKGTWDEDVTGWHIANQRMLPSFRDSLWIS